MTLPKSTRARWCSSDSGTSKQHRVGLHVLDVGLDQRSALLDDLDDFFLADDRFVDQRILGGGEFAARHGVLLRLLFAEDGRTRHGRKGGREEEGDQRCTGGGS